MFERLFTSTLAYLLTSGTVASRSSPEMAGTGACLIGSTFMAMVPPVAKNSTTGLASSANADVAIRQTRPGNMTANLLGIDSLPRSVAPAGAFVQTELNEAMPRPSPGNGLAIAEKAAG